MYLHHLLYFHSMHNLSKSASLNTQVHCYSYPSLPFQSKVLSQCSALSDCYKMASDVSYCSTEIKNGLRQRFCSLYHLSQNPLFNITFSCNKYTLVPALLCLSVCLLQLPTNTNPFMNILAVYSVFFLMFLMHHMTLIIML